MKTGIVALIIVVSTAAAAFASLSLINEGEDPSAAAPEASAVDAPTSSTESPATTEPGGTAPESGTVPPPSTTTSQVPSTTTTQPDATTTTQASTTTTPQATSTTSTVPASSTTTTVPTTSSTTSPPSKTASGIPPATQTATGNHYVFDTNTVITSRFVLRAGDSVELKNGACMCFGMGGSADWQGTKTSTWSGDGRHQNLTRDIKITGKGHIRFEHGSTTSTIRYVEIDLRPPVELAKYPLHFHHAGDGVRGTLVEGVVVKNSPNRAFVPHASHGITFRDTIAKNISGSPYWWDPPAFQSQDQSQNSNDTTFDHALADGVTPRDGERGGRLGAFTLGMGTGNAVVNSAAMNVKGGKDSSGFVWPEGHHRQPHTWIFRNNVAHDNVANGIFVWQNNQQEHIIDGFRGYNNGLNDLDHGAYKNRYDYRNVTMDRVEVHALGWSITGGSIGTVTTRRHALDGGNVTFTDVAVGQLIIENARNNGDVAGTYVFTNTGLTWDRVTLGQYVPGTTVIINGESRTF